jgi:hypothetical protein
MKKHLFRAFFALMLVTVLALSVGAAEWITKDVTSKLDEAPDWYVEDNAVELEVWDMGDTNANSSATGADGIYPSGYVFLKAKGLGNFEVPFDIEESGNYNIGFVLMAWKKSVPRSTTFSVDGAAPIYICYDYADEDQYSEQFLTGPTIYLEKGEHTLTLALGDDFDDTNVKSLYFDKFIYAPAGDAPAAAADAPASVLIYGYDYNACGENVNPVFQTAEDGTETSIALKPLDAATAATCWWDFELDIPADGNVNFVVTYAANGDRYMDVTFNGTTQKVTCPDTGGFDFFEKLELNYANVKAGKQMLRFAAPADFNNSDIKTPNIDYFEFTVTAVDNAAAEAEAAAQAAAEAEAAALAAAEAEAAAKAAIEVETAPQTFDFGVIAAVSALLSLMGFTLTKKK